MSTFTIKEIEKHRQLSGKIQGLPIAKTLVGRFLTANSIYTTKAKTLFNVKSLCKASMKKDLRKEQIYIDVMKFKLKHNVSVRETGIVIQQLLYWLAASPDGLIADESATLIFGLIEIKCPFSKRNLHPQDMLKDKDFYVELRDRVPYLKARHSNGYYSQIQMAMSLSQLKFCDFIVYSFKGMIIIRISFSTIYSF